MSSSRVYRIVSVSMSRVSTEFSVPWTSDKAVTRAPTSHAMVVDRLACNRHRLHTYGNAVHGWRVQVVVLAKVTQKQKTGCTHKRELHENLRVAALELLSQTRKIHLPLGAGPLQEQLGSLPFVWAQRNCSVL